ncbi:phosphopantetheine-binding protein [Paenibacillus caseinilyticus]
MSLPTYTFARERYWFGMRTAQRPLHQPDSAPLAMHPVRQEAGEVKQRAGGSMGGTAMTQASFPGVVSGSGAIASSPAIPDRTAQPAADKPRGIVLRPTGAAPDPGLRSDSTLRTAVALRPLDDRPPAPQAVPVNEPLPQRHLTVASRMEQEQIVKEDAASVQQLAQELAESLADALLLSITDMDMDKKFVDMGLDSIVGVEWMRTINRKYGTAIPATKVYDYPSIGELAAYLAEQSGRCMDQTAMAAPAVISTATGRPVSWQQPEASLNVPSTAAIRDELAASLADALILNINDIDTDTKFVDLGLDSIVGVEWMRTINRRYGTAITATKLYDFPTLSEFAKYIASQLNSVQAVYTAEGQKTHTSVDDVLHQVSNGELDIQQAEKLLIALGGI